MARIKRETIILVILLGIVLIVSSLIIINIRKEQNFNKVPSVQSQVNESELSSSANDLLSPSTFNFIL